MIIRRIEYTNNKQITAIKNDPSNNAEWIAYAKNDDNKVIIKRQSAFEPIQTFFTIEREVEKVNRMTSDTIRLYVSYDDPILLGEIFSLTNPLTSFTSIDKPIGIVENSVDLAIDGADLYYLIPGNTTGTNAKILKYNISGILQETIDLSKTGVEVINADGITVSDTGDIWVVTFTDPATVVRVFELSGGGFDFEVTEIV